MFFLYFPTNDRQKLVNCTKQVTNWFIFNIKFNVTYKVQSKWTVLATVLRKREEDDKKERKKLNEEIIVQRNWSRLTADAHFPFEILYRYRVFSFN